jgi:hypothetical protein
MKRGHILWVFENLGPHYKPHDYNFKRINFKHKNIVALVYFLVNTFKIGFILFLNKMRYFLTCTISIVLKGSKYMFA